MNAKIIIACLLIAVLCFATFGLAAATGKKSRVAVKSVIKTRSVPKKTVTKSTPKKTVTRRASTKGASKVSRSVKKPVATTTKKSTMSTKSVNTNAMNKLKKALTNANNY